MAFVNVSLAKESFEKAPAVSDGCCLFAQSLKKKMQVAYNCMHRGGLFIYLFVRLVNV